MVKSVWASTFQVRYVTVGPYHKGPPIDRSFGISQGRRSSDEVLSLAHDDPSAGHPGRDCTVDMVRRSYNWPGLTSSAALFVRSCDACQKSKASRSKPAGPITPLPIPNGPWY